MHVRRYYCKKNLQAYTYTATLTAIFRLVIADKRTHLLGIGSNQPPTESFRSDLGKVRLGKKKPTYQRIMCFIRFYLGDAEREEEQVFSHRWCHDDDDATLT